MLFWSLQILILFSTVMYITDGYKKKDKTYPYLSVEMFNYCLSTAVSIFDNLLIINAFNRLQRSLGHDSLGISKKNIFLYIGTFLTATLALIFLYSSAAVGLFGLGNNLGY